MLLRCQGGPTPPCVHCTGMERWVGKGMGAGCTSLPLTWLFKGGVDGANVPSILGRGVQNQGKLIYKNRQPHCPQTSRGNHILAPPSWPPFSGYSRKHASSSFVFFLQTHMDIAKQSSVAMIYVLDMVTILQRSKSLSNKYLHDKNAYWSGNLKHLKSQSKNVFYHFALVFE